MCPHVVMDYILNNCILAACADCEITAAGLCSQHEQGTRVHREFIL